MSYRSTTPSADVVSIEIRSRIRPLEMSAALTSFFNTGIIEATTQPGQDVYLQLLDSELQLMVSPAYLPALKRCRNAMSRWCRLPPEILGLIFRFVKDVSQWPAITTGNSSDVNANDLGNGETAGPLRYDPGWTTLIQICRYWREVAMGTPRLWTHPQNILAIPQNMISRILEQSRTFPLHLELLDAPNLTSSSLTDLLVRWFPRPTYSRLGSLCIYHVTPETFQFVEPHMRKPMAMLRKLHVGLSSDDTGDLVRLPSELLLNPSLVDVTLSNCIPSTWNPPAFGSRITRLELTFSQPVSRHVLPSPSQFAELISSIPTLNELHLQDAFPAATSIDDYPIISLPIALGVLSARATAAAELHRECLLFLGHLLLDHDIHMQTEVYDPSGMSLLCYASTALQNIYCQQSPPQELVFGPRSFLTLNAEHYDPDRIISARGHEVRDVPGITSVMSFHLEARYWSPAEFILRSLLPLLLRGAHTISFEPYGEDVLILGDTWWRSSVFAAQAVRRLAIHVESSAMLLGMLTQSVLRDGLVSFPAFPQLETIEVHVNRICDNDLESRWYHCAPARAAIQSLVRERKSHNASLRDIIVDESLRNWSIWDDIRALVLVKFTTFSTCHASSRA